MTTQTLNLLQQLGFTSYESKAYVALLESQPSGAYDIAKRSGVPTSKVYETINKLLRRNILRFADENVADNPQYVALPPESLSEQLNQQVKSQTKELLPLLKSLKTSEEPDFIWPLTTIASFREKAESLVQTAQKSILISCWPEELGWLSPALKAAEGKGIQIALVHFGQTAEQIGATYHHPVEQTIYAEKGGRGLTLVTDGSAVIIGSLKDDELIDASWSKSPAFVAVAEDYIKHDVYITKVTRFLDEPLKARFGDQYQQLRNIFDSEA